MSSLIQILRHGRYAPMTDDADIHEGDIVISHDRILDVCDGYSREKGTVIDLEGALVTPGLIDCHTHLVYAGNRGDDFEKRNQGQSYQTQTKSGGGIYHTVKLTQEASKEKLFKESASRLVNLLREGVTTVEIKSGYGLTLESERNMLQVAKQLEEFFPVSISKTYLAAHICPQNQDANNYIHRTVEWLKALVSEGLVDAVDAFVDRVAFLPEQVNPLFKMAQSLQIPIKMHAEQLGRVGAVKLMAVYENMLSIDHVEYVNEDDIPILQSNQATAVILPGAYYFLQSQKKPPISLFRESRIPLALATDCNPGSSPVCSLLTIMNMASVLFGMSTSEIWLGTTRHAASALGRNDIGTIQKGKMADLVVWQSQSLTDIYHHLGLVPKCRVMKSGRWIEEVEYQYE